MKELRALEKQWRERQHFQRLKAGMVLEKEGVTLGGRTLLAKRRDDGSLEIEGNKARLLTLLAVAQGGPIDASVFGAFRRASAHAQAGDEAMAAMHIALAPFPRLRDPEADAKRIFIADGLMKEGVSPRDIWNALEFDTSSLDALEKFNPGEPRNPKGDGHASGEWTRESTSVVGSSVAVARPTIAEGIAEGLKDGAASALDQLPEWLMGAAEVASRFAGPVAFASGVLIPTPAGGEQVSGEIFGRPDLRYSWFRDETEVEITRASDGQVLLRATLGPDGKLRVGPQRVVGRLDNGKVVLDPFVLPPQGTRDKRDDPDMCPKETEDRFGRGDSDEKGKKDKDYEDHVKEFVNPGNPTPRGFGYPFIKPSTGKPIIFDDCQHSTGDLYEAKGTTYSEMLAKNNPKLTKWLNYRFEYQARNQIEASEGREIYWCFAEAPAADYVRKLFRKRKNAKLKRIGICYLPWTEGMQ